MSQPCNEMKMTGAQETTEPKAPSDAEIYVALPRRGYADAIERVGFTAAPLLAGFAVTFIGLILGADVAMRWPNATLVALTTAVMLLILSVQLAFNARAVYVPYPEFKERLELISGADVAERSAYVEGLVRHRHLVRWIGVSYNLGIAALLSAVASALVPAGALGDIDPQRKLAIAVAVAAALGELGWILLGEIGAWRTRRRAAADLRRAGGGLPA